jgi:hypothetical protein
MDACAASVTLFSSRYSVLRDTSLVASRATASAPASPMALQVRDSIWRPLSADSSATIEAAQVSPIMFELFSERRKVCSGQIRIIDKQACMLMSVTVCIHFS